MVEDDISDEQVRERLAVLQEKYDAMHRNAKELAIPYQDIMALEPKYERQLYEARKRYLDARKARKL